MLRGDDPQALLRRAEGYWSVIRDALLNPEDWDDLVARVRPTTPEEKARLARLVEDIRAVVSRYGLEPPRALEDT